MIGTCDCCELHTDVAVYLDASDEAVTLCADCIEVLAPELADDL